MPTAPTHAVSALALGAAFYRPGIPARLWIVGAALAALPDVDVVGFRFGIRYEDLLGHRGLTHGLPFAVVVAAIAVAAGFRRGAGSLSPLAVGGFLALATASHGFLDAFTDGGLGIAFFSPFDPTRYFAPFRPIAVSPISPRRILEPAFLRVVGTELLWVWLPSTIVIAARLVSEVRRDRRPRLPAPRELD